MAKTATATTADAGESAPDLAGKTVTVLTATYNDWTSLARLLPLIDAAIAQTGARARVVVVDDGSNDVSGRETIAGARFAAIDSIDEVALGANQGNQRAIAIGIAHVARHVPGDYLIVMDSDHEDPPHYIPALLGRCVASNDRRIAFAARARRSEGWTFRIFYRLYRALYQALTGLPISVGNFSAVPGAMVVRLAHSGELWNHYPAAIMRARLPFDTLPTDRGQRIHGKSAMNLVRLVVHAFSGFTVHADVVAVRVLFAALIGGLGMLGLAAVYVGLGLFETIAPTGWSSLMGGLFVVIFLQVATSAMLLLFLSLSLRLQPPLIPAHDYGRFVVATERLYPPVPSASRSGAPGADSA